MEATTIQKPSVAVINEMEILKQFNKLFPSPPEMKTIGEIAEIALKSGFLSKDINSAEKAQYIILKAKELEIPPILGLTHLNVISGKVCASAELMMVLIRKNCPTAIIEFLELSTERCMIHAARSPREKKVEFRYDREDIIRTRKAKMEDGQLIDVKESGQTWIGSWAKHPRAMLRSRCVSEMARSLFPDAIAGVSYTPEELGAEIGEEGEILNINKNDSPEIQNPPQQPEKEKKKLVLAKKEPSESHELTQEDEELIAKMEDFEKQVDTYDKEKKTTQISFEDWLKSLERKKFGQDTYCKTSAQSIFDSGKAHQLKFTEFDRSIWFPTQHLVLDPDCVWIKDWILMAKKKDFA